MVERPNDIRLPSGSDAGRGWGSAIAESTDDAIIGLDLGGYVVFWNRAASVLFGYLSEEILGRSVSILIPVAEIGADIAVLDTLRRGEPVVVFETERLHRDGSVIAVAVTVSSIRDRQGRIIGISQIIRDCTEMRRARVAAERQTAVLTSVFATSRDGLVVINDRGLIDSFSGGAETLFGFHATETRGRNVSMLMPSSDRENHDGYLARYSETGVARIIGIGRVVIGQRKNGSVFPLELSIGQVDLPGERLFTGVLRDVTEHQEDERRLKAVQDELIHVTRLAELDHMASSLAHEVAQPLTAIGMYLAATKKLLDAGETTEARAAIDELGTQAERAKIIVQRIRSMIKNGETEKKFENLPKLIEEATAIALAGAGRSLELSIQIADDATEAFIDKVQIQQVLLNLIRNAVEAMDGAPQRKVSITADKNGDMVEIRVADSGPGLSEKARSDLFQPFATTKANGLGMGLSISQTIVNGHGGQLLGKNGIDGGAIFSLTLPTAPAAAD